MKHIISGLLAFGLCTSVVQAETKLLQLADLPAMETEERNYWFGIEDVVKAIQRSGSTLEADEAQLYLQGIMDRLYPEWKGFLHVHIIKDADYNAFALANGHIYVNAGLIGRLDNEAQIAIVLAHEGAHVLLRHSYKQWQNANSTSLFAQIVIAIPVVGILASFGMLASIYGYSRDAEREADQIGFERFKQAGYSLPESVRVFEILDAEAKARQIKQPVFYASHPSMQERIDSFRSLVSKYEGDSNNGTGEDNYWKKLGFLREQSLQMALDSGHYDVVLAALSDEKSQKHYPPYVGYYKGEAYRLRRTAGDETKALQAYQQAHASSPLHAPTLRGLGIVNLRLGNKAEAAAWLQAYLESSNEAQDKAFIEEMLEIAKENAK